jgi:hypothetical protein
VFLIINENHNYSQIIGNPVAPIINALADSYGLATAYEGVSDPSEPNYVAMLGGSDFGISSDDPYFFPGQTVSADNLMSQLDAAGKTWRGYFQDMPYPGYRGYCFPGKCNGIPDSDTEYVAKHNGIVNFANMQTPAEFAKQMPFAQLAVDLSLGHVPNFGYIVADECHDMHGAPPWCVDSGNPGDVDDNWLVATGDRFVGSTVDLITSSPFWKSGNNAIVVTWDEGNFSTDQIVAIVATSHGPRGKKDPAAYNHYSLLASLEGAFGLGCLLNSCTATPMAPLFEVTGSNDVPALPPPFVPAPNGTNAVSPTGTPVKGDRVKLDGSGWRVVPSPSIGTFDNVLASVSAAAADDVWAVGTYYPIASGGNVLAAMGEHFDGTRWTEYPLPNVGINENALFSVSMVPSGAAWAVGYYIDADYQQRTLTEHYDGTKWSVVPSADPGAKQNILYGVVALADDNVWAVGGTEDEDRVWHTLSEHWDGSNWTVVPTQDPGATGNLFYAVTVSNGAIVATGQIAGTGFPGQALVEEFDGQTWEVAPSPVDPGATDIALGITSSGAGISIVGDRETGKAPYTTLVAAGPTRHVSILSTPNSGAGENDLFGATTAADGSTWAVGWLIDPSTDNHLTLIEHGVEGQWSVVPSPNPNASLGDVGLAGIVAVPGGGLWAVGETTNTAGNYATLILYHP